MKPYTEGLVARQWKHYCTTHASRANLLVHLLTVPVFMTGTAAAAAVLLGAPATWAVAGIAAMGGAIALQGRGHARELARPEPFRGPLDVLARLLVEQWITFPRYVLTGELARAWRRAAGDRHGHDLDR